MKKIISLVAVALMMSVTAKAQIGESSSRKIETTYTTTTKTVEKKFTNELDFYIQNGWGLGYQLRREFSPYIGYNAFGISYMSGFNSPADFGEVNLRLLGFRVYTPSYNSIRGYADLNTGYTFSYFSGETSHHFGLDFGVGVQVHKNIAIGYNLHFTTPGNAKSHWGRIAFLF